MSAAPVINLTTNAERYQASQTEWDRVAFSQEFKNLMATKKMFIITAFVFFIVYYFALPILVGYAPHFMASKVFGVVNLDYFFAVSQFLWRGRLHGFM